VVAYDRTLVLEREPSQGQELAFERLVLLVVAELRR
jgi:hypothetical protein